MGKQCSKELVEPAPAKPQHDTDRIEYDEAAVTTAYIHRSCLEYHVHLFPTELTAVILQFLGIIFTSNEKRILFVGMRNSGTYTIMKQFQMLTSQLSHEEITGAKDHMQETLVAFMQVLCRQSLELDNDIDEALASSRQELLRLQAPYTLTKDVAHKIELLWNDAGIKESLNQRHHFQIPVNVGYFLDRVAVISSDEYEPIFEDYLKIRGGPGAISPRNPVNLYLPLCAFKQQQFTFVDAVHCANRPENSRMARGLRQI